MKNWIAFTTVIIAGAIILGIIITEQPSQEVISESPTTASETVTPPEEVTQGPSAPESTAAQEGMFTLEQIAEHGTDGDCYTAINDTVYDLTAWVHQHPGGDRNILKICGIDGSSAFNREHGRNQEALNTLSGFEIGVLVN